jgi:alpha-galactosidase
MWRTGGDIGARWEYWTGDFDANYNSLTKCVPGDWADPDMLEVGVGTNMTDAENRSMFSMWCMMSAPLIMGFNVSRVWQVDYMQNVYALNTTMFTTANHVRCVEIQSNIELIALDQDTIGLAGRRIKGQGALEVWVKNCADGAKAVALFNRTGAAANMSVTQTDLGWGTSTQTYVRDLWTHESATPFSGTFTKNVATHATEVYKMSTAPINPPTEMLRTMDRSIAWLAKNGREIFPRHLIPGVMTGADPRARIFDLRGRAPAGVNCRAIGPGMLILRADNPEDRTAAKMVWQGIH